LPGIWAGHQAKLLPQDAAYRRACIGSLASFWLLKEENHENHAPKKHTRINRVSVRNSPRGASYCVGSAPCSYGAMEARYKSQGDYAALCRRWSLLKSYLVASSHEGAAGLTLANF